MKKAICMLVFFILCCLLYAEALMGSACTSSEIDSPCEIPSNCGHWEVCTENGERFLRNPETGKNIYRAVRVTDGGFIEVDLEEYAGRLNAAILEEQREHSAERFVPEDVYGKN